MDFANQDLALLFQIAISQPRSCAEPSNPDFLHSARMYKLHREVNASRNAATYQPHRIRTIMTSRAALGNGTFQL